MTGKKIITQILLVIVALGAGGAGTYYWMTRGGMSSAMGTSATQATKEEKKERKIKYWVAPMNPSFHSDKPGKSPMGMDLVPVYEDEGEEPGTIRVDPNTLQSIGVRTTQVRFGELSKTIRTVGRVTYDERRITTVNSKVSGWIEKLYVNTTGEEVRKGAPLIDIYSPELVSAQREYLIAHKHYEEVKNSPYPAVVRGAADLLDSAKKRLAYWDITEAQIAELNRTGDVRKTLTLNSPFRGVVVSKAAFDGSKVMAGMELFRIADLSRVWVQGDVYEYELPWVKVGVPATVTLDYLPGKKYRGTVTYVYPYLEGKTRTATVRVELSNPRMELKPDMYAHVELAPRVGGKSTLVPSEAVIRSGIRNVVFLARGEGRFQPREVTLGLEGEEGTVQVLKGLSPGDNVVISSQFLLDSESSLKEALGKFQSGAGETATAGAPTGSAAPSPADHKMEMGPSMKGMDMGPSKKGTEPGVPMKGMDMGPSMKGTESGAPMKGMDMGPSMKGTEPAKRSPEGR